MTAREAFVLWRAAQDWRALVATVVIAALAAAVFGSSSESLLGFVGYYGPPLVGISAIGRRFEYSQRSSVWVMLAQRPETDVRRSWSVLGVGVAMYLALSAILMVGAMVGILRSTDLPPTAFRSHLISMSLWIGIAGCAVSAASTAVRAGTAGVAIGWLLAPFLIVILKEGLGFSDHAELALQFLTPPFDAVFLAPSMLRGEIPEQATIRAAQLVSFPILCLLLIRWRLRAIARPDQRRTE